MGMAEDVWAADFAAVTDTDGPGETVRFIPHTGVPHNIDAVVLRRIPTEIADGKARSQEIIVMIPIGAAPSGRPSINTTVDKIELRRYVGGSLEQIPIAQVLRQSGGRWKLRMA